MENGSNYNTPRPQGAPVRRTANKKRSPLASVGKIALVFVVTVVFILSTALISVKMICGNTSPAAKQMFVTTLLETGQMKWFASLFLSADEIKALVDGNSMDRFTGEIDTSLIVIDGSSDHESGQSGESGESGGGTRPTDGIEIKTISGRTFSATMMIIKNPSRVSVATTWPFGEYGKTLAEIVEANGAIAGINGGLYSSYNNTGGYPFGVVVENGNIRRNIPNEQTGLYLIGLTENNILQIIDMQGKTAAEMEQIIKEKKIRDAVTFQEEASDSNNHFVTLILNGESRTLNGYGSGLNPRTAIGQRADGALLLLVTDGRGSQGHLGASASDLISIMEEYGAVNAANLDGGSSSCMYYNHDYLMDSVTFYYKNTSWRLPFAFVVK